MTRILAAFLAIAAAAQPSRPETPQFTVELFSNKMVEAVTLKAAKYHLKLCGRGQDGACSVLAPGNTAVCRAGRLVQCQAEGLHRSFAVLTLSSPHAFEFESSFAGAGVASRLFWATNVNVHPGSNGLKVVTQVNLETYVAGVVAGEGSVQDPAGTRGALAILARTWALRWQGRHHADGYDFCSLTHCQVFRPVRAAASDLRRQSEILAGTGGHILRYHGALADPYFSACCGGITEAAENVWPDSGRPYLVSAPDPYCVKSPQAAWQREFSAASIEEVLRKGLQLNVAGPLREFTVEARDSSQRAVALRVTAGSTWRVDANAFRYALNRRLGWNQLKSNFYTVRREGNRWVFTGHGLGHGVGLCQAGAEQMGRAGFSAERILFTYFPGTEIAMLDRTDLNSLTPLRTSGTLSRKGRGLLPPPSPLAGEGGPRPALSPAGAGRVRGAYRDSENRAAPVDDSDPIASSEHFELAYPASEERWVTPSLQALEKWRRELGLHAETLPAKVHVQTWPTTAEFAKATGQPGWMAGVSDGGSITLQPLSGLARKHVLEQTLRHELTHLVVHKLCAKDVPRWFEEGLVLYLTGEVISPPKGPWNLGSLNDAITSPRSEEEMRSTYAQALERVRRLAQLHGEPALWQALEHPTAEMQGWYRESR